MPDPAAGAARVVERCRRLAEVSEERGRLTRRYATPAMAEANALVGAWMAEAGLEVHVDAAANLVGRRAGADPAAGTLLLGSHLDTVRDAGAFDGPLGVLAAVECLAGLPGSLPFTVEVLGFSDEEGLRFGTPYLGSRAIAGTFGDDLLALTDDDGIRLDAALRAFGGDPAAIPLLSRGGERILGYCELHIEQGPVLDDAGLPLGIVTGIAGATRATVTFSGVAAHAGTVPMGARRDALCAAAEWALAVEALAARTTGLRATVGRFAAEPGAVNVIPGRVVTSADVRHAQDGARRDAVGALRARAEEIAVRRGVEVAWATTLDSPAVDASPALTALLAEAVEGCGVPPRRLMSGAGHDGVALAAFTGIGMLFVRSPGGVSHHPDEAVREEDVAVALAALGRFLGLVAERGT